MKSDFDETIHEMTFLTPKIQPGLERIKKIDEAFGYPSRQFPSIHIAGTNAKGSIALKIAQSLYLSGKKVGLYTSPHFFTFRERIQINGQLISESEAKKLLDQIIDKALLLGLKLSFFEALTQVAFCYFAHSHLDYAVIETGLGGRLDATNIIESKISVITSIGRDHEDLLGNTLYKIAREKAGIIKKNQKVILGPRINPRPFLMEAKKQGAKIYQPPKEKSWELDNKRVVQAAIDHLDDLAAKPLALDAKAFGRFEIIQNNPLIIADVAHNKPALLCFLKKLSLYEKKPLFFIVAFSTKKRAEDLIFELQKKAEKIFLTQPEHERIIAIDAIAPQPKLVHEKNVKIALNHAIEQAKSLDGIVVIVGSFFLMPEALALFGIEKVPEHWGEGIEKKNFSNIAEGM